MAIRKALQFVAVLRRRKTIIIAAVAASILLGMLHYSRSTPIYQTSSSLLVRAAGRDAISSKGSFADISRDLKTYVELFSSDAVLSEAGQYVDHPPPGLNRHGQAIDWASALRGMIHAARRGETTIIDVTCQSQDPKAAVSVLNAVIRSYREFIDQGRRNIALEIVETLDGEREAVREQIAEKGEELLLAKKNSGDLSVGDSGHSNNHPLVERVVRLNASLIEAQKERITLQSALVGIEGELQSGGDVGPYLINLEPILGSGFTENLLGINPEERTAAQRQLFADETELQSLRQHYGPGHSEIRMLEDRIRRARQYLADVGARLDGRTSASIIQQRGRVLLDRIAKAVAVAAQREVAVEREYRRVEAEAIKLNERLAHVQIVQRDLERLHNLHETILARISNIDINQETSGIRASVVRRPKTPQRPVSPKLAKTLAICVFVGLVVGSAIIFVLDLLDDRFGSPEEISEQLRAPVLAMVRELPEHDAVGAEAVHIHVAPDQAENEAFRTLRTALTFAAHERDRLAVTSTQPSDGKTTVISNLAASYAQSGKRTLVIDGDLRKPGLTSLFGLRRHNGLSEILRARSNVSELCGEYVQFSGVENLDILPCGPKPSNPAELLSGSRLEEVVAWAEMTYDKILVDCPPVLAASDAAMIGKRLDGLLLVVDPHQNHRRLVLRAAEDLHALQVPVIGVVVNRISDRSDLDYGYGYGHELAYGADEIDDLEHDDEDQTPDSRPVTLARRAA